MDPDTACQAHPSILLPNDCTSYYSLYQLQRRPSLQRDVHPANQQPPITRRRPSYPHKQKVTSVGHQQQARLKGQEERMTGTNRREALL